MLLLIISINLPTDQQGKGSSIHTSPQFKVVTCVYVCLGLIAVILVSPFWKYSLKISVAGTTIKTINNITNGYDVSFTTTELTNIYKKLPSATSGTVTFKLTTKSGSTYTTIFEYFIPLISVALIYLVMVMILTSLVGKLERRLRKSER